MMCNILDLDSIVSYNEKAIVSRTIIESETGTITAFAFDKGQNISEHTAPFDAIVQVIDGRALFVVGGKSYEISKNQIIIMPAGAPHEVKAIESFKMLLTMMKK
jgi:quercetin dioxygenase-like cupin family protein